MSAPAPARAFCGLACAALLAALALPLPSAPAGAQKAGRRKPSKPAASAVQSWKYGSPAGTVRRYRQEIRVTGGIEGSGIFTLEGQAVASEQTESATDAEVVTLDATEEQQATLNDQAIPFSAADAPKLRTTFSRSGVVLRFEEVFPRGEREPDPTQALSNQLNQLSVTINSRPAPPKPVRVGESWKTQIPNFLAGGGRRETLTSTLQGRERIGGADTLKIAVKARLAPEEGAEAADLIPVTGFYNIDPKAGVVVRSSFVLSNVPLLIQSNVDSIRARIAVKTTLLSE